MTIKTWLTIAALLVATFNLGFAVGNAFGRSKARAEYALRIGAK
jgi:hypothetical protein